MNQALDRWALHLAYRKTRYRVNLAQGAFDLLIDRPSPELAGLYRLHQVTSAAFATAHNPQSRPLPADENRARHGLLLERINGLGHAFYAGAGLDPKGEWPAEESVLILGIDFRAACELGRTFDQAALVYAGVDCIPRLSIPSAHVA